MSKFSRTPAYVLSSLAILLTLFFRQSFAQVSAQDSLVLVDILKNNCNGCELEDLWDTSESVRSWQGILVGNGRIKGLGIHHQGLTGVFDLHNALDSLENFDLHEDSITEIRGIENLENIDYLSFTNCPVKSLPDLSQLSNLKDLILDGLFQLEGMPGIENCRSLQDLFVMRGAMRGVFDGSKCPENLRRLVISDCRLDGITELPPGQVERLQYIYLENCHLISIPSLAGCDSLTTLLLPNNQLSELPNLQHLGQLTQLDIRANNIRTLPKMNFGNLSSLLLAGNPITELPDLKRGPNAPLLKLNVDSTALTFARLEALALDSTIDLSAKGLDSVALFPSEKKLYLETERPVFDAESIGGSRGRYQWFRDGFTLVGETSAKLYPDPKIPAATYHCEVSHPLFPGSDSFPLVTKPVTAYFEDGVRCFDPNGDRTSSILDVIGVGMHYGEEGIKRPMNGDLDPMELQPAFDWVDSNNVPRTILYNGREINLKHFDSNGDGVLDEKDLDCVKEFLQPVNWDSSGLHKSLYGQPYLRLRAEPDEESIWIDEKDRCWITYHLKVDSIQLAGGQPKIKGLIFIRPEVQNTKFTIDSMYGDFTHSEFAEDVSEILKLDKFYQKDTLSPEMFNNESCVEFGVHPLEIALFRKDTAVPLKEGQRLIDCVVIGTIDDLTPAEIRENRKIPLILETTNIVLFEELDEGNWRPYEGYCTVDETLIPIPPSYCKSSGPAMEVRGGYRTHDIFVDHSLDTGGGVQAKIWDKKGKLLDSIEVVGGAMGTFCYPGASLRKGKYRVGLEACDGSSCEASFARRGRLGKLFYYWFNHRQPPCKVTFNNNGSMAIGGDGSTSSLVPTNNRCTSKINSLKIKAGFKSQNVYFNFSASGKGRIQVVIRNKKGNIVHQGEVQANEDTYRFDMGGLRRGKYIATLTACDGSSFAGEFARKGSLSKPFYYGLFQPKPYLVTP